MHKIYVNIDMKRTGQLLKFRIDQAGYSVKDIQRILMLSCPQPIYRWYNGKILPSVDHLFALSRLLGMHMHKSEKAGKNDTKIWPEKGVTASDPVTEAIFVWVKREQGIENRLIAFSMPCLSTI